MNTTNVVSLGEQFKGRKFGELVLHHVKSQEFRTIIMALQGTIAKLPNGSAPEVESWIDEIAPQGKNPTFWQRDCGEALLDICGRAQKKLAACGIIPTDEDLLSMFQIIVLNFAYGAHKDAGSKAFIQKSIGIGFLRRAFTKLEFDERMLPEKEVKLVDGLAPYSTFISVFGALFVGFLQLPGWLLIGLAALAVYGMRYYYPTSFLSGFSYIKNFVLVIFFLSVIEWVARIASLYMTGYQFVGRVE